MIRSAVTAVSLLVALAVIGCGGSGSGQDSKTPVTPPTLLSIEPSGVVAGSSSVNLIAYGSNFEQGATVQWNGTPIDASSLTSTELHATIPDSLLTTIGTANITIANYSPDPVTSNSRSFAVIATPVSATTVRSVGIAPHDIAWDPLHGKLYASVPSPDSVAPDTLVAVDPTTGKIDPPVTVGKNPGLMSLSSDYSFLWVGIDGEGRVQRFKLPSMEPDVSFTLPVYEVTKNNQQAVSLEAARINPHTVAVIAGFAGTWGGLGNGVFIYDDDVPRPVSVPGAENSGGGPPIDWIQWASDDSTLFATQDLDSSQDGIGTLKVNSSGVSLVGRYQAQLDLAAPQYVPGNGMLYSYGAVVDPVKNSLVGLFDLPGSANVSCISDISLARYYCVLNVPTGIDVNQYELRVYDLNTFALVERVSLGKTVSGLFLRMVRWGKAGLALSTYDNGANGPGGLFLIEGTAVNPSAASDATSGTSVDPLALLTTISPQSATEGSGDFSVTITGKNFTPYSVACLNSNYLIFNYLPTTYVSPTQVIVTIPAEQLHTAGALTVNMFDTASNLFAHNSLGFTIVPRSSGQTKVTAINLAGLAMAWDPKSALLFAGTADWDAAHPNSIVAIDPTTAEIKSAQPVSADPFQLSLSAGSQYLYVGFAASTTMTQLQLPGLNSPVSWVLDNPVITGPGYGPYYAGDLKAAPENAHTTAVTLYIEPYDLGYTMVAEGGIAIYDDAKQRPVVAPGFLYSPIFPAPEYNVLAWGATDSTLAAAVNDAAEDAPLYTLAVNPSGAMYLGQYPGFNDYLDEIHSDTGTGLIYSDNGNVADPVTGAIVGTYGASGMVIPDSSLNRVFILGQVSGQAQNSYTIESFNQKTFAPISTITIDNVNGSPVGFVRWGTSGLALETFNPSDSGFDYAPGMLYILQNSSFVSNNDATSTAQPQVKELVQRRWKQITKKDILKMSHSHTRAKTKTSHGDDK